MRNKDLLDTQVGENIGVLAKCDTKTAPEDVTVIRARQVVREGPAFLLPRVRRQLLGGYRKVVGNVDGRAWMVALGARHEILTL